jgi:hypothetical protein
MSVTGYAASKYTSARYRAKKIIPKNETANETQMIDSYMLVTGGRPAIMQRMMIPAA